MAHRPIAIALEAISLHHREAMDRLAPQPFAVPLPPLPDGWQVVSYSILADGALAIVGADVDLRAEWSRIEENPTASDPFEVAARGHARIWTFDGITLSSGPAFPLLTPFPIVDRFPGGRWLVASVRARDDINGRVIAEDGRELGRLRLGDGIGHLKIDDAGHIWVGWFDEGVFGNEGWRIAGHEWPPSSYGLAAFDDQGNLVIHAAGAPPSSGIADCYALNVVGGAAWACSYTDFPILSIRSDEPARWWPTELNGPRAIAVSSTYVLAAGDYGDKGDRVLLVHLGNDSGMTVAEWQMPFMVGLPVRVDFIDGRGDTLHVVQDDVWYRWRVQDFIAQVGSTTLRS